MLKKSLQQKVIGYCLIPVSLLFLLFRYQLWEKNFTGLLSDMSLFPWIHIYGICLLLFVWKCMYHQVNTYLLVLYVMLVCLTFTVSYVQFPSLHLLFGYGSFVLYQYLWLKWIYYEQHLLKFYMMGCLVCMGCVFVQYHISGIPEMIYAIMMSILLTKKVV